MASFQAPTNVLQALSTDCQKLLTEYDRMQSLRFSDFAKVWSNMNFGILLLYVEIIFRLEDLRKNLFS